MLLHVAWQETDIKKRMEHSNENEQIRDVYALFGLAVYQAQCVEREIGILLTTVYGPGIQKMTRTDYDTMLQGEFKKTFGGLIATLRKAAVIPGDFDQKLADALNKRNWLAHHYFWDRAGHFMTEKGRQMMMKELQEVVDQFAELDAQITKTVRAWSEKYGVTQAVIEQEIAKLISDANNSL